MKRSSRGINPPDIRKNIIIHKPIPLGRQKVLAQRTPANIQKIPFEFTTTATCRISLIKQTYDSFRNGLVDIDFSKSTLYINIDPIGGEGTPEEIVQLCKNYFGNVISNTPTTSNFCAAIKWLWQQPKGSVFFHLEDDWILKVPVKVQSLMRFLTLNKNFEDASSKVVVATIRAYRTPHEERICLSPGGMSSQWAHYMSSQLDISKNPEQQCRLPMYKRYKGAQFPTRNNSTLVHDIGRAWMSKRNYHKGAGEVEFVDWRG